MYGETTAAGLVARADTSAQVLAEIAPQHPALWNSIAQHPNAYPELVQWVRQAQAAQEQPQLSQQPGQQQPAKRKKTGLIVGLVVAGLVVLSGAGVGTALALGAFTNDNELQETSDEGSSDTESEDSEDADDDTPASTLAAVGLELVGYDAERYTIHIYDTAALEEAIGDEYPSSSGNGNFFTWIDPTYGDHEYPRADFTSLYSFEPETLDLIFAAGGFVSFTDWSENPFEYALLGEVSEDDITANLGEPAEGANGPVWEDDEIEGQVYFSQVDGKTYFRWEEADLPTAVPDSDEVPATNSDLVDVLNYLEGTENSYQYILEHDAVTALAVESLVSEAPDEMLAQGAALRYDDGNGFVTLAYNFGDAATAEDNLSIMQDAFDAFCEQIGHDAATDTYVDDGFVVVEFELSGMDVGSEALGLLQLFA